MTADRSPLRNWLNDAALAAGFHAVHVTAAHLPEITAKRLAAFVAQGFQGDMSWLADSVSRRAQPRLMWPDASSAIILTMNYGPDHNPMDNLARSGDGNISVYARGRDYHEVIKGKLKQLAGQFAARAAADVKVFVDTAPLMEKPLAQMAGAGWQGKHTNLVSRSAGSWLFLGTILTDADLPHDAPENDHCGNCTRCLDICPTKAFVAPYKLDARRCISYLTIEHKGQIPESFGPLLAIGFLAVMIVLLCVHGINLQRARPKPNFTAAGICQPWQSYCGLMMRVFVKNLLVARCAVPSMTALCAMFWWRRAIVASRPWRRW